MPLTSCLSAAKQAGFNTQYTWSFAQLVTLHYQWPFSGSDPALAGLQPSSNGGGDSLLQALGSLITPDSLRAAANIPRLPPSLPPDYSPAYTGRFSCNCVGLPMTRPTALGVPKRSRASKRALPPFPLPQATGWAAWRRLQTPTWSRRPAPAPSSSANRAPPSTPPASRLSPTAPLTCCRCAAGQALNAHLRRVGSHLPAANARP